MKVVTGSERGSGEGGRVDDQRTQHLSPAVRPRAKDEHLDLRHREPPLAAPVGPELRAEPRLIRSEGHSRPIPRLPIAAAFREEWSRQRRQSVERHDLHDAFRVRQIGAAAAVRLPHPRAVPGGRQRRSGRADARRGSGSPELRATPRSTGFRWFAGTDYTVDYDLGRVTLRADPTRSSRARDR